LKKQCARKNKIDSELTLPKKSIANRYTLTKHMIQKLILRVDEEKNRINELEKALRIQEKLIDVML